MGVREELQERGIVPPDGLLEKFRMDLVEDYYGFLKEQNEAGGFFSKGDTERILERHLYESMVFANYVSSLASVSRETRMADAGTGPGLPGYLFHCLKDSPRITLIDSSKRRLWLLEQFARDKGQTGGLKFLYSRLEEMKDRFDLVVARALIPYPFIVELVMNLQVRGGKLALFVSHPPEGKRAEEFLKRTGYVSRETIHLPELEFLGERHIILLIKEKEPQKGYPRNWKFIKEEMQKWEK